MKRYLLLLTLMLSATCFGACGDDDDDIADDEETSTSDESTESTDDSQTETEATDSETEEETDQSDSSEETDDTGSGTGGPLEIGDEVPDFTLNAHDGQEITLSDYRGQIVLIGAHPFAGTAVCTQQTEELNEGYDKFMNDYNTIPFAFGSDGSAKQATWAKSMGLDKLLILSDSNPKGAISKQLGIWGGMSTSRANVIIDQEGKLVFRQKYNMAICPPLDPIFAELEKLQ